MPQRPNILIVDPNEQDMQLLEISLRNMKFAITTATNTFEALKKVEIFPPDLIISETNVEDFDGFELCKNIKENDRWAQIPFIFLASDKDLKSKVKGLQLGVDDYLTKPIFLVELVARIKMLMQRKERESIEKQESRTRFTGSLSEIGIVDIIQTIDLSKKKGVVHLAHDGETGAIYFEDGDIVDAELAQQDGEEAVYRMMRWSEGFFDIDFRPIRREKKVSIGVQQLLMEGLRRLDEWNRILEQLPPMATIFNVDVLELIDRLDEIPDEVNGLVALFDGQRSLDEVVSNDIFTDLDTLRIVSKLIFFGVLIEHEQKTRAVERPEEDKDVIVGASEVERERKSTDSLGVPAVAPQDLQFGKAEEVDIVEVSAGEAAPDREEAGAEESEAVESKAAEEVEEKEEKKEEKEEKKEALAEAEKKVIGKIEIKKVPVEVIGKGPDAPVEKLTPKKGVIIGEKTVEVRETKGDDEDTVRKRVEDVGVKTIKVKAPSIPSTAAREEELPSEMKEGRVEEEVLSAIDSKIQQLKEGKAEEDKKAARKEEEAGKEEEAPKEEGREAPTARMYSKEAAREKDVEEALKEKLTARWTFPVSDSGFIEEKLKEKAAKEEKEKATEEGRDEVKEEGKEEEHEEAARTEGRQHIEEEPAKQEEVRKGMVQAISLNEVKEEIEKREKDGEEKKEEKKEGKKKEMTESGAYSVEDKEFFRSAPTGDEPVDTFEDLDFGSKGKREKSTKGLTYAIWTIILLGIAGVLFLVFGKDLLKQGPDLTLLDKLEEVEPVSSKPLMEKSMEELSPMEGEGEEAAPQPGQEEGEGEEQASPAGGGTEEAAGGTEEGTEGSTEGGTEEGTEGTEEGKDPEPPVAPSDSGAYAALLAEAKDLMAKKKKKDAIEKFKEAVNVNPNGQEALSILVDNYKEKPKPEVLAWGKKATQLGPNDARAWFGYGLALFTKGNVKEAKPVFEHCIEIEPPDSSTNNCKKMLKWCK